MLLGILSQDCLSQDPVFSQFYNAPLQLNPGLAGNSSAPVFHLNYRNQWPGLGNIYTTYAASYSQFLNGVNSGVGVQILSDNAGDGIMRSTRIAGTYSYRLKINRTSFIKGGIEAGFGNLSLDWDRLTFGDGIDPRFGSVSPGGVPYPSSEVRPDVGSRNFLTISSGLVLYNPNYYVGLSVRNMNTPNISFVRSQIGSVGNGSFLPILFSLHGGMQIILQKGNKQIDDTFISPNVLFATQSGFNQLTFGSMLSVNKIFGGVWYRIAGRNQDALIVSLGMKKDFFKISYSFDYTTSSLSINQGGSHEVGIVLNFDSFYPEKVNYNDCFQIFR
ncbi:MAG: PorP/SprF family type IX secretion system membrane protein [Saprospiraceae bacterium]|nr:PorP/SprF family type IX secretion system membrane protein [Saprospiraceae bacterium]